MERWGRSQSDRVALGVAYGLRKCVRSICGYWLRVWEISIRGEKSKLDVASIRGNDNVNTHSATGVRGVSNGSGSIASLMQDQRRQTSLGYGTTLATTRLETAGGGDSLLGRL